MQDGEGHRNQAGGGLGAAAPGTGPAVCQARAQWRPRTVPLRPHRTLGLRYPAPRFTDEETEVRRESYSSESFQPSFIQHLSYHPLNDKVRFLNS